MGDRTRARLGATSTLSVHVVRAILARAAQHGLDVDRLIERFDLDRAVLADVDGRVPAALLVRMWDEVPVLVGDPAFGLHLGEEAANATLSLATHLLSTSENVRGGMRRLLAYSRVFNDVHPVEWIEEEDRTRMRVETRSSPIPAPRHAMEFIFAWIVGSCRRSTGRADLGPLEVRFEHAAPADASELRRVFRCPVHFEADAAEIHVHTSVLELAHLEPDPHLRDLLESHAKTLLARLPDRPGVTTRVREVVVARLRDGEPTIDAIAGELRTSPRTLQRWLADEQTTYQKVLDELRLDLARQHLTEGQLSLGEIALVLGFSEQSAFTRAFARWTGKAPGEWRREKRAGL